jgi:hypothetical protein
MAELTISTDEVVGIKKEIEEGSLELIFNALQSDIYSFPIKSFIRETISNGLDSNIEKNVFRKIDAGDPVEKYFLQRQDNMLLKDSEYDPTYYSKDHLSHIETVIVEYIVGNPRDKVIIKDYGVGLGGNRLKGYFKIGWSSKRNFLTARGLYGLGSKSALATGVDYYTMTTVYNGYKTCFMIYNRDYENITPESSDGKTEIWKVTMANNSVVDKKIFWEKTNEPNSVTIEVEVKKHNKNTYINATKDQFQYFNGKVHLGITEDGYTSWDKLNEAPEYESDNLLIPKYSTYSSPHILVDGISYGLVSWDELELQDRKGKIALKVTANQVDITQSRESLKWTDKTKNTVLEAIRVAEEEAAEFVRSKVKLEDEENIFLLNSSFRRISDTGSNSVISTFSRFLQISSIRPSYSMVLDEENTLVSTLNDELFQFMFYGFDFKRVYTYTENNKLKIKTDICSSFDTISGSIIVYADESSLGPKLANHLLTKFNVNSFIYVRENVTRVRDSISLGRKSKDFSSTKIKRYSREIIKKYCDLNLDEYDVAYDETTEIEDVVLEDTAVNLAKIRKMNKEIMWYEHSFAHFDIYSRSVQFVRTKKEFKISELSNYTQGKEIIIVPAAYAKLGKMLIIMNEIKRASINFTCVFVAEDNIKYFEELGCTHIKNYFRTANTNTGELMIGQTLVDINTAYQMAKLKKKYESFSNNIEVISSISTIDKTKYDSFKYFNTDIPLREVFANSINDKNVVKDIFDYLDTLANFQTIVGSKDKDLITAKAVELFNSEEIYNVYAYDKDYVDSVEAELERLSVIGPIIKSITYYSPECGPLLNLLLKTIHNNS